MRADLVTWSRLVRTGFRRQSAYRMATVAGLCTNVVFGFIRAAILFAALDSAGGSIAGYDKGSVGAYVWLSQGLLGAIQLNGAADVGDRVRTGDVAVDLTRPVDLQTWHLAEDLGRAAYTVLPRLVPSVVVGALTAGLALPATPWPYVLGPASIVLGVALSFYCRFAVNVLGFWLLDTRGLRTLYMVVSTFLAGLYVPVALFPGWLGTLAHATPFPSILQVPIDIVSGRLGPVEAAGALAVQCCWVAVACVAGRLLMAAGHRRLVVQGG